MSGSTIGTSFNYGFIGNVSTNHPCVIEEKPVVSGGDTIPFGRAAGLNTDNTVFLADTNLTASNFYGVAVAEVKQLTTYTVGQDDPAQVGGYLADQPADIIQQGIVAVNCHGTPTAGGAVYVRKNASGGQLAGEFRTTADGGDTVQLTNCAWASNQKDANGVALLKIKTINL